MQVFDAATLKLRHNLPSGEGPEQFALTRDGRYAFVALGPANHVAVVDAKTYQPLKYLLVLAARLGIERMAI